MAETPEANTLRTQHMRLLALQEWLNISMGEVACSSGHVGVLVTPYAWQDFVKSVSLGLRLFG